MLKLIVIRLLSLGGELFAKRRKKADKWVVDEQNVGSTTSQFASQVTTTLLHTTLQSI